MKDADPAQLVQQADALVKEGKIEAAIALVESGIGNTWHPAPLHEWLGRRELLHGGDPEKALASFEHARRVGGWRAAIPELGMAFEALHRDMDAYFEFGHVAEWEDSSPTHRGYARLRQAAILERRGLPRLALSACRRLMVIKRLDAETKQAAQASASALEARLTAEKKYFPHQADEALWIRSHRPYFGDRSMAFADFLEMATTFQRLCKSHGNNPSLSSVLEKMIAVARSGALVLEHGNVSLTPTIVHDDPGLQRQWRTIVTQFSRLHHLLYGELLEREESLAWGTSDELRQGLTSGHPEKVWAVLEDAKGGGDYEKLWGYAGVLESAGDLALVRGQYGMALRHYDLALEGFRFFASGASSGGEGMSRMIPVNRVQKKRDKAAAGAAARQRGV